MAYSKNYNNSKETTSEGAPNFDSLINYLNINSEPESTVFIQNEEQDSGLLIYDQELHESAPINLNNVAENPTQSPELSTAKDTNSEGASYLDPTINCMGNLEPETSDLIENEELISDEQGNFLTDLEINKFLNEIITTSVPENSTQPLELSTSMCYNELESNYLIGNVELITDEPEHLQTELSKTVYEFHSISGQNTNSFQVNPTEPQYQNIDWNNLDEILSNEQNLADPYQTILENNETPIEYIESQLILKEINSSEVGLEKLLQSTEVITEDDTYSYDLPNPIDLVKLPKLTITKQPSEKFSFSTNGDIGRRKPGTISVTIKMVLPNNLNVNYDNIFAICMLCEKFDSNSIGYKPSINFLAKSKDDINCKPKGLEHIGNGIFELKNAHILRAKKSEERETIYRKYVEYNKLIKNRDELNDAVVKKIENMIANKEMYKVNPIVDHSLMIEVFENRNNEHFRIPGAAIYSNFFSVYLHLKIDNKTHFSTNGIDVITLQVSDVIPTDSVVHIFNIRADNRTVWDEQISYNELTISGKKITFKIPEYKPTLDDINSKIECKIEIIYNSGSSCSRSIKFFYIGPNWCIKRRRTPQTYNKNAKRRRGSDSPTRLSLNPFGFDSFSKFIGNSRNSSAYNDDADNMQDLRKVLHSTGKKNSEILTDIVQLNDEYIELHKNEDTILHEVIRRASNNFLTLYKKYSSPNLRKLFCEASNCFGENLLHYACMYDKPEFIRPLIGMGCGICGEEKRGGQTPLHIAIQQKKHKCIEKFRAILKNHRDYPEAVNDLKNLFTIYNFDGYTVMHLAILNKLEELVLDMLKFCKDHDVDVCATKVLCNGDTILHLAASQNLMNALKSIAEYFPTALDDENYEGLSILDIKDGITSESVELSPEMIELIEELEIHSSM